LKLEVVKSCGATEPLKGHSEGKKGDWGERILSPGLLNPRCSPQVLESDVRAEEVR